jgi:predicted permease
MFTVVNGVLLKPMPYPDPGRLAAVSGHLANSRFSQQFLAYPDFQDCRRGARSLDLSGWVFNSGTLSEPGDAEYEQQFEITRNLFDVLGVHPLRGRAFLPDEDRPGGSPVTILGYSLWQRRFGGDPSAIGRSLVFEGRRYTIVGIAPAGLQLDGEADLYMPLGQDTAKYLQGRRAHPVRGIARLRPGAAIAQARAEIAAIGRGLEEQHPDTNRDRSLVVEPLHVDVSDVVSTIWLLLGAVTLVLLIACANVAGLLLARTLSRTRELAMRVALGAGRWRLARQCLTESAVLGLAGGALGVGLAILGIRPFLAWWPGDLPRAEEVRLDWTVLLFALAISLLCGLVFGLAPALRIPARALERTLRLGARGIAGGSRRMQGAFVAAEIALAVVLLVSAGLLGRTLLHVASLNPGVDVHNVLVTRMAISPAVMKNPERIRATWADALERARHIAGVESVATVDTVPLREGNWEVGYWPSAAVPPENQRPVAIATSVTPDYFRVMGIQLRQGRLFTGQDRKDSTLVAVIDDVLAQTTFGTQNPIGKQLWIPDLVPAPLEVVGVVGHVRYWGLAADDQAKVRAQFYYPFAQVPDNYLPRWSQLMSLVVRTGVPPLSVVQPLRRELRGDANDQVLYQVRTLEQLARNTLARQRFLMLLFGIFAALSLLLACIGIYGVLAHLTSQRVPEFGVRMALGATAGNVIQLVLRQSAGMILCGVAAGTAVSMAAARVLQRLVEGMQPAMLSTVALMIAVLIAAALFASFVPARRASRIDPVRALRQE